MSTKIYNAYVFHSSNLEELYTVLDKMKKEWFERQLSLWKAGTQKSKEAFIKDLKEFSFELPKKIREDFVKKIDGLPDYMALDEFFKTYAYSRVNSPFNIDASVMIYPLGKKLYVQFFLDRDAKIPKTFADYHYQNQSDQPEDVTNKEWKQREKTWDRILGRSNMLFCRDIPANAGFVFEFSNESVRYQLCIAILNKIYVKNEPK